MEWNKIKLFHYFVVPFTVVSCDIFVLIRNWNTCIRRNRHLMNIWGSIWNTVNQWIKDKLDQILRRRYTNLGKKIDKSKKNQNTQTQTNETTHNFLPRTVNLTHINFIKEEMQLIKKENTKTSYETTVLQNSDKNFILFHSILTK